MKKNSRIFVAGASGLVGSAIVRSLLSQGYTNIIGSYHSRQPDSYLFTDHVSLITCPVDLISKNEVDSFFAIHKPEYVFLAAAKVGGIVANNTYRADFIHQNLMIQGNVIDQACKHGVKKLLFLGSTCIYPRDCPQPMKEEYLLTGPLEYTNEPYAVAKIAGIKMCESYNLQYGTNFISVMPTNLYGPGDNFDLEKSHVLPAMVRKMHMGKCLEAGDWHGLRADLNARPIGKIDGFASDETILRSLADHGIQKDNASRITDYSPLITINLWGTGTPRREFMWSEDMADACVFLMEQVDFVDLAGDKEEMRNTHINIGTGEEITIAELADKVKQVVGFKGKLVFNSDKPDGTLRKLTDVFRLNALGWHHKVSLEQGLGRIYNWYCSKERKL